MQAIKPKATCVESPVCCCALAQGDHVTQTRTWADHLRSSIISVGECTAKLSAGSNTIVPEFLVEQEMLLQLANLATTRQTFWYVRAAPVSSRAAVRSTWLRIQKQTLRPCAFVVAN